MPSIEVAVSMLSQSQESQSLIAKMITETVENMAGNKSGQDKIQNAADQIPAPPADGKGTLVDEMV
jgi:hypothetical protein